MIATARNLLIVLAGFIAALLLCALGQKAFSLLLPGFSTRVALNVDFATHFVLVLSALVYFLFGSLVPRWLGSSRPLIWLLIPIVSLYVLAVAQGYPLRCNPFQVSSCWMIQSILLVPAVAIVTGYMFFRANCRRDRNVV